MDIGCKNCSLVPTKTCFYRAQLFIMICMLVLIYHVMYIHVNSETISQLIYERTLQSETISNKKEDNIDMVSKLKKFAIEAKQNWRLPKKTNDVNKTKISYEENIIQQKSELSVKPDLLKQNNKDVDKYKVVKPTDGMKESKNSENQQKAKPSSKPNEATQKANQSTNLQKEIKLCDPSDSERERKNQKDSNQLQKANGKSDQVNQNQTCRDPRINATHVYGTLMEPVNVNYTRNIYFSVKTTHKYYTKRLFLLMLTWLQTVDKDKLFFITDKSTSEQVYVDIFRKAGFNIIDTGCAPTHARKSLCCKMGSEFAAYYKALEEHSGEEDKYQWFCHSDDDVYVNVLELSRFLKQYDPQKPYYVGKFPQSYYTLPYIPLNNWTMNHFNHDLHLPLKKTSFEYATGSMFCASQAIMMEAKKLINGPKHLTKMCYSVKHPLPDDMIVGFIFTALLGHNLTNVMNITNEYDLFVKNSSLPSLISYITVSTKSAESTASLSKFASSLKTPLPLADPTRLLLYHCLLHPTISWCSSVREKLASDHNNIIYADY